VGAPFRIALATAVLFAGGALVHCGERLPPTPAQPIEFSHEIHAGRNGIGCLSCHAYAERGPVAGIPSMARCQGCHKFVKEDKNDPAVTARIQKLLRKLEEGTAIEWVRVHRVPDHVYFTHQRHVLGGVRCQECHGEVEKMEAVRQVSTLTMGWCLDCHKRKQAERAVERARLTDCWTCHK
jgi:hypothetical protein